MVAQKPELGDSRSAHMRPDFKFTKPSPILAVQFPRRASQESRARFFLYRKKLHDGGSNFQMQTQTLLPQLGVPT